MREVAARLDLPVRTGLYRYPSPGETYRGEPASVRAQPEPYGCCELTEMTSPVRYEA